MTDISNKDSLTNFDVISFARKILSEVENIRSFSKVTDEKTGEMFQLHSESRTNAFFRLIGLPMFVNIKAKEDKKTEAKNAGLEGKRHLTPGFSRTISPKLTSLYTIEHNGETDDGKLVVSRERSLLSIEQQIGTADSNEKMVEALKTPIPLQANVSSVSGSTRTVFKQLKPLITFYLPDGVLPRGNEMARPFLSGQDDDLIDSETRLDKPFIETVIRIRLIETAGGGSKTNQTKDEDVTNSITDFLGLDKDGNSVFEQVFPNKDLLKHTDIREGFVIAKLTSALQLLANKWVALKNKQQRLASQVDFDITINSTSAKSSPFGRRASVSTIISDDSVLGKQIKRASAKVAVEESFVSLLTSDDSANPNKTTPKVKETKNISKSALTGPFNEIINHDLMQYSKSLNDLKARSKKRSAELDKLRVELDLMTGEFTGLSMPDVIIVMMALFLISEKELVSLIDKESRKEMEQDTVLKEALKSIGTPMDASEAVAALEKVVDSLYKLLDINIRRLSDRKEITTKLGSNKKKSVPTKRGSSFESK